ncbi:MAG: hypothetical protein HDQ87_11980 [Clostridia bacterium]|nr:hypothetical protein [Clostridia bacterium]
MKTTQTKLNNLSEQLLTEEWENNADFYEQLTERAIRRQDAAASHPVRRIVLLASAIAASMLFGALVLADFPVIQASRSAIFERLASQENRMEDTYESLEDLEADTALQVPSITYIPPGFELTDSIRVQYMEGAPIITIAWEQGEQYLNMVILEDSIELGTQFSLIHDEIVENSTERLAVLSTSPPYSAEVEVGKYVFNIVGNLSREQMLAIIHGISASE